MKIWGGALLFLLLYPGLLYAHFGVLLVNPPMLTSPSDGRLTIQLAFAHPRAAQGLEMARPVTFAVRHNSHNLDLLPALKETRLFNTRAWAGNFTIQAPGDYIFHMSPAPYWEEAEQRFIVHHSKTVVNAYDMQAGWDDVLGLPVEIIPLTRPYGLYPGNVFSGQVRQNGQPLPDCPVEIEFFDAQSQKPAANDALLTQTVKTNAQGYFSWSFPWAGWWGMSALADGGQITHNGKTAALEVGGVLWLYVDHLPR